MNNDPFIFLHVPKTAGTTLRAIIERQYSEEEIYSVYEGAEEHHSIADLKALDAAAKTKIRVYCGHVGFGVHREIGGNPKYITMLRDPVERVISYYHHEMTLSPHWKDKPISLLKFVQEKKIVQTDNLQTRLLSGNSKPFGQCTDNMLSTAIENAEKHFSTVGVAELFDEFLVFTASDLGWLNLQYVRENVGKDRPITDYYSRFELTAIADRNRLDALLYSHAKRRLQERIRQEGPKFEEKVSAFRKMNMEAATTIAAKAVWG